MATTLKYNGLTILNCLTTDFSQENAYDESDTDTMCEKVRITVQGMMHGLAVNAAGYLANGAQPAVGLNPTKGNLQQNLLYFAQTFAEPRKILEYKAGSTLLLRVKPHSGKAERLDPFNAAVTPSLGDDPAAYPDVRNGPRPQTFRVLKVVGEKLLEVEFTIECHIVRCSTPNNQKNILSNRWSVKDAIDDNWYTTRTYEGILVVAHPNIDADSFRGLLIPPLQSGFIRTEIETTTDPSGLKLAWRVTDRQTSNAPPFPATRWTGTHKVASGFDGSGMNNTVTVDVQLWGPEGTTKEDLIATAAAVCRDRTNYRQSAGGNPKAYTPVYVNALEITDHLEENSVSMHLAVTLPPAQVSLATIDASNIGAPINLAKYDRLTARQPSPYGTSSTTGRFICYLQTACDDEHDTKNKLAGLPDQSGSSGGGIGINVKTLSGQVTDLPEVSPPYDSDHQKDQYTHYRIDSEYPQTVGKVVLPVASANTTPSPGDKTAYAASLNKATQLRIIRIECERLGAWPAIPEPKDFRDTNGIQHTLISSRQILAAPHLTADGVNSLFGITMEYVFSMDRPFISGSDKLESGSLPWDKSTPQTNSVPAVTLYQAAANIIIPRK